MKIKILHILLIAFLIHNSLPLMSQGLRMYRPLKFELIGVKQGVELKNSTKNFDINIYEDGRSEFMVNLSEINIFTDSLENPREFPDDRLVLQGNFPLEEMRNNQQTNQSYRFDLDVQNNGYSNTILFDVQVVYNKMDNLYNITMIGKVDLRQYPHLYEFGLEPFLNMIISFETKWK